MNTNDIREFFDYNLWANNRLLEAVAQLPDEEYHRDLKSSHGGIHGTLLHIVGAQKIWLSRWKGTPDTSFVSEKDFASKVDLIKLWDAVSSDTAAFLAELTDQKLQEWYKMTTSAGKQYTNSYLQTMQHMVNHSSIHRGQVSGMMRQLGIKPPGTDLITYYRRDQA